MHVFTRHRQVFKISQNMAPDFSQHFWFIGADVKHFVLFFCHKGIEAHGKYGELSGTARGFKQAAWVGVKARWGSSVYITYTLGIIFIRGLALVMEHIFRFYALVIELAKDLFRRHTQIDTQMVDQR